MTGRAIDVQYLGADDAVCVVFDSGDVVLVRLDTNTVRTTVGLNFTSNNGRLK